MTSSIGISTLGLLAVLVGVVVVLILLRALSWVITALPMSAARRATVKRLGPVLSAVIGVGLALAAVRAVFVGETIVSHAAALAVVVAVVALSWFALRDLVAGVFWKAGSACQLGDAIRFGELTGRVTRFGLRVLVVEGERGDRVFIPYGRLLSDVLVITNEQLGAAPHVFTLNVPPGESISVARDTALRASLLCHGASVARPPRVRQIGESSLEVTVFAAWSEPVMELEHQIRRQLEEHSAVQRSLVSSTHSAGGE